MVTHHMNTHQARPTGMGWLIFVAGAVLSWGAYGVLLAQGQSQLGNPLKALLCVGAAYFLIGVIVPVAALGAQGGLSGFNTGGLVDGDDRRRPRRDWRCLHHLGIPRRRPSGLRDAAGVRGRADRERAGVDGDESAEGCGQSAVVRGVPSRIGGSRDGSLFQAGSLARFHTFVAAAINTGSCFAPNRRAQISMLVAPTP